MTSNSAQKALTALALILLVGGVAVAVVTLVTWPEWDPAKTQANMASFLNVPVSEVQPPTEPLRVERWAWVAVGGLAASVGVLAGLLALHAASIRGALRAIRG